MPLRQSTRVLHHLTRQVCSCLVHLRSTAFNVRLKTRESRAARCRPRYRRAVGEKRQHVTLRIKEHLRLLTSKSLYRKALPCSFSLKCQLTPATLFTQSLKQPWTVTRFRSRGWKKQVKMFSRTKGSISTRNNVIQTAHRPSWQKIKTKQMKNNQTTKPNKSIKPKSFKVLSGCSFLQKRGLKACNDYLSRSNQFVVYLHKGYEQPVFHCCHTGLGMLMVMAN